MAFTSDGIEALRRQLTECQEKEHASREREQALSEANARALLLVDEKDSIIERQRAEIDRLSLDVEAIVEERTRDLTESQRQLQGMVRHLQEQRDRLAQLANTDPLTELHNHRSFQERLDEELARSHRYQRPLSLLLIDLDRFKLVNDTFGHPAGDSLIQQVAALIRVTCRKMDIVARYGGDEFAVILPETPLKAAVATAEKIRSTVEQAEFRIEGDNANDRTINATLTIGVSSCPAHSQTKDGLIVAADIAMYSGKHLSRNKVSAYVPVQCGDEVVDPYEMYRLLHEPSLSALTTLAAAVDARDSATVGHSERVTKYALMIADQLNLPQETRDCLRVGGLLHDVGKLGIPDKLLLKPTSLTCPERESIQHHPEMGKTILEQIPQMNSIVPLVYHHHERWDGKGYPAGIAGTEIPLLARILAVADAYDAMTSERPYRKAMDSDEALSEARRCAGTQFDPEIVEAFVAAMADEVAQESAA